MVRGQSVIYALGLSFNSVIEVCSLLVQILNCELAK